MWGWGHMGFAGGARPPPSMHTHPPCCTFGAQDQMPVYPVSISFWPFRLTFSAFFPLLGVGSLWPHPGISSWQPCFLARTLEVHSFLSSSQAFLMTSFIFLFKVKLYEVEFLRHSGNEEWLRGLDRVPKKLRALSEINTLLAHQPWLITTNHIEVGKTLNSILKANGPVLITLEGRHLVGIVTPNSSKCFPNGLPCLHLKYKPLTVSGRLVKCKTPYVFSIIFPTNCHTQSEDK